MLKSKILRASVLIGFFSLVAAVVALLRDRILASHFGATRMLDIYYSAFKLPDLVFNIILVGSLSSAFIPVFIGARREDEAGAWLVARNFTTVMFTMVVIAAGILFVFAGQVVGLIAPGFVGSDRELAISLTRIMFLSPVIFSLSAIAGSILQSLERFWAFSIAPVLYNIGIIIGAVYFSPWATRTGHSPVIGLAWGVVLGALFHFVIQGTAAWRAGFRFKPHWDLANAEFRKILKLMVPRTIGLSAYSVDSAVTNAFASLMAAGSITVFNLANNGQFVPISMVGIAVATAVFPKLSQHASASEHKEFKHRLSSTLKNTAMIILPLAVVGYFLTPWAVRLIFGIGLFKGAAVAATVATLQVFLFGVPGQCFIPILSRAFYALHNTRTPVIISVTAIALNIFLGWYLGLHLGYGVKGLAAAFAIAGNIQWLLLWIFLKKTGEMLSS